jgi:hypothetical protein
LENDASQDASLRKLKLEIEYVIHSGILKGEAKTTLE